MKEKLPKFFQRVAGTGMLRVCMKVPPACRPHLPDPYKDKGYLIQHLGTSDVREAVRIERSANYIGIFTRLIDVAKPKPMKWAYIPPTAWEIERMRIMVEGFLAADPKTLTPNGQRFYEGLKSGTITPVVEGRYEEVPDEGEKPTLRFEEAVDLWANERKVPTPTRRSYKARIADLAKYVGHDIANRITRDDLIGFKDGMVKQGLASKTIRNYLGYVMTVFTYLAENNKIDTNPADKPIRIKQTPKGRTSRREFDEDDRAAIYRYAMAETRPLYRWANLLMLFSGMRGHEFAEADTRDIKLVDSVWCILLDYDHRTQDNQTLKTDESIRKVPLHRAVLDAGFLEYVRSLSPGPLFPMLEVDRDARRRADASRKLSVWLRETVGITDVRKVNHSHRHSVETLMCAAGVRKRVAFAVTGHAAESEGDKYIHPSVKMLKAAVEKIPIPKLKVAA